MAHILTFSGCQILESASPVWAETSLKPKNHGAIYKLLLMYADGLRLSEIAARIEAGKTRAIIDSTFTLDEVQAAFERSKAGRSRRKLVVSID
jgi:NADPH:quinone reductase-like Zn-dependent oxidoreductase